MFTGIIQTVGIIKQASYINNTLKLAIEPYAEDFEVLVAESVAVDGVCLTVESISSHVLYFTAVMETIEKTTLSNARPDIEVNLERAFRVNDRVGGHFVLGHVDSVGRIIADRRRGGSLWRDISVESSLYRFMPQKGSVAIDGISLTIVDSIPGRITISLIPYTLNNTTMGKKRIGDRVNIECDVFARYIDQAMKCNSVEYSNRGTSFFLDEVKEEGF